MRRGTLPIHWKFTVGFILIFSIAAGCLYAYMSHILAEQTKVTIREDMKKLQTFAYDHIQQYSIVQQASNEQKENEITPLLYGISRSTGHPVAFYDKEGTFIGETFMTKNGSARLAMNPSAPLAHTFENDRTLTLENKSVVTMLQDEDNHLVLLSFPYYTNNQYEGLFRITSDYSSRYAHNAAILKSFAWFIAALFVVITVFTYMLSNRITRPLFKLSHAMKGFGEGRQSEHKLPVERGDEAGQLAASFIQMKGQIEEQLAHLAAERNRVVELEQSKRRFYQHITHELKTPLTSISGYAQIIGEPGFDDPVFLERAAGRIKTESDRLHSMVVQVLELARREEGEGRQPDEPVELGDQLEACCEDMELKASRYDMVLQCDVQALTVSGQREELRKVWVNLLDNAIKYGATGTTIRIQAVREEGYAVVQVRNECDQEREADELLVFEPFYRDYGAAMKEPGSIGLGLAICRSIVASHEGTIDFRQEGSSVLVQVKLPLWT